MKLMLDKIPLNQGIQLLQLSLNGGDVGNEGVSKRRQGNAAVAANKNNMTDLFLQTGNGGRDHRLRDKKISGSSVNGAGFRHLNNIPELIDRHSGSPFQLWYILITVI